MKPTLTVFVALIATLIAAPASAAGPKASADRAPYNPELTVKEVVDLRVGARQLQQARLTATRDGVVTRVERKKIENLQQDLNRDGFVYTRNNRRR